MSEEQPIVHCDGFTFLLRREKLKVGSEWECTAECLAEMRGRHNIVLRKGSEVRISAILSIANVIVFTVKDLSWLEYCMPVNQFLLCNKPKERKDE